MEKGKINTVESNKSSKCETENYWREGEQRIHNFFSDS